MAQRKRNSSEAFRKFGLYRLHSIFIMLTQLSLPNSAKEVEHYQRVRASFEGPAKPQAIAAPQPASLPARTNLALSPGTPHLQPPSPDSHKHPKFVRSNTAKKDNLKGKGKGKATKWDSDTDDDDDDAYVTSNDSMGTPDQRTNGSFGNGVADDDEDMYQ